jgi:hypothetical protein
MRDPTSFAAIRGRNRTVAASDGMPATRTWNGPTLRTLAATLKPPFGRVFSRAIVPPGPTTSTRAPRTAGQIEPVNLPREP